MQRHAPGPRRKVLVVVTRGRGPNARVLVLRRAPPKPDEWQPVTGGVESGESYADAAEREVWEETSLRGTAAPLGRVHKFTKALPNGERFEFEEHVFALASAEGEVAISSEHRAHKWASTAEAAALVKWPHHREAIVATGKLLGS